MKTLSLIFVLGLAARLSLPTQAAGPGAYFGITSTKSEATGFFRLSKTRERHHLITPDGHAYLALGINHIGMLNEHVAGGLRVQSNAEWVDYWERTLQPQFVNWHLTTIGYGTPSALKTKAPWFATITLVPIEKHRSDPSPSARDGYHFPDVFDPVWASDVTNRIHAAAALVRDDPFVIGYFWTDTPTWDLIKTRGLRGTDWVSAIRALPVRSPGREAYADFLEKRYLDRLDQLNSIYGLDLSIINQVHAANLTTIAIGRRVVQEDDEAFLSQIAKRFYDVAGKAQRDADPNHLVFGDRYLIGDAPEPVLKAAAPWIDAVAVQPGDRYSPLYPPSTQFPETEIDRIYAITGKPVLICDHAISFPTSEQPRTIFEQMPDEASAAKATADFLEAAFEKPYMLGYLRCQYIDRPANYGRGLRQGILRVDGTPRDALVKVYRERFESAIKQLEDIAP